MNAGSLISTILALTKRMIRPLKRLQWNDPYRVDKLNQEHLHDTRGFLFGLGMIPLELREV
jgi:hypothetical protein